MDGPFIYYQLLSSENGTSMCAALKYVKTSPQKISCPQKMGLIVPGPFMFDQLLSSESGPQCVRPLTVLRKWASLCMALYIIINYYCS